MQTSNTVETILWCFAGLIGSSMMIILTLGWFKGVFWEQQLKMKRRNR